MCVVQDSELLMNIFAEELQARQKEVKSPLVYRPGHHTIERTLVPPHEAAFILRPPKRA